MKNGIEAMITDITATTAEAEDYTGEDGLLYCGKCHTPKEAYFAEGKTCFGRDRHPAECDCQRAAREKQQAAESRQKHLEKVEDLKRRGFTMIPASLPILAAVLEIRPPFCRYSSVSSPAKRRTWCLSFPRSLLRNLR